MNDLSKDRIAQALDFECDLYVFDMVASTNDEARRLGGAVFAHTQTNGRGRRGRKFFSGEGGLYFSLALKLCGDSVCLGQKRTRFSAGKITVSAGIAVAKTLERYGVPAKIKWVNDVLVGGKKICGILAERTEDKVILGIGIDVNNEIPPDLASVATSLRLDIDLSECAARVINAFYAEMCDPDMDYFNSRCVTIGKKVATSTGTFVALRADEDGALIVNDVPPRRIFYGEATILD